MTDPKPIERPLPETELRIVISLLRLGACSASELARHLTDVLPTTVYTLLLRLATKELVESEAGLRPGTGTPFSVKPSRTWSLRKDRLDEILRLEFDYLLDVRYCDDPLILSRLAKTLRDREEAATGA